MKQFWQTVIRFRIVLAVVSLVALLVTAWLRNAPSSASAPTSPAEMPVATAISVNNSITDTAMSGKEGGEVSDSSVAVSPPSEPQAVQPSSQQGGTVISANPNASVKEAMSAPTVQSNQVSSFETTNPYTSPQQGLLNNNPTEKGSKVGEQF
jgi:hypothetical protein